jgi:hypothetical protein
LGNVWAQAAELADRTFPLTQALSELRPAMFVYRVSEIDYVFTQDPDERDLRNFKMQSGLAEAESGLAKLLPLLRTPEEKKILPSITADLEKCKAETSRSARFGRSTKGYGGSIRRDRNRERQLR